MAEINSFDESIAITIPLSNLRDLVKLHGLQVTKTVFSPLLHNFLLCFYVLRLKLILKLKCSIHIIAGIN